MKNRFIPIAMIALLTGAAANAQVGIGELNPSPSSQLEVKATNKGILIPRVSLTGTTDNTTITSGNVNSLLVFNTATTADVTPGYYYWHVDKWVRIMTSEDASVTDTNTTNTSLAVVGGNLVLTDSDGNTVTVPVADINSGANGNTLLNGTTAPAAGVGQDGDFYINTTTNEIYGPKTGGSWGTPTSLVGPQGPQGPAGANGQDGVDGKSMLSGTTAPAAGLGQDGDVYVNTATGEIYGPKTGGNWGAPTSLKGADGQDGTDGKSVLNGAVAPTAGVGQDGDFYIDTVKDEIYGPKTGGNWGTPTPLKGADGQDGADGKSMLSGTTAPAAGLGQDGDVYVNTATGEIYGPKTGGNWGAPTSLKGADGQDGTDGVDGKSMLSGTTAPAAGLGQDGDVYVNTATGEIYGPKTGGNWGAPTSLVGPQGPAGANGQDGTDGQDGKSVLNGAVAPTAGVGQDGDFYIDTVKNEIYGPKTGGNWGAPTSLVGPEGAQGTAGNGILNGNGAPAAGTGNDGDFYINTDTNEIYGPKTGGNWGAGTSLVGPGGATIVKDDNATTKVSGNGSTATPYKVEVRSDVKIKTSDYTATMAETVILADANAAQVTITLPAASADNKGKSFIVKKQDKNEDNDVVVSGVTSVSGNKVSTAVPFTGWEFLSDGTDWHIVNKF